MKFYWTMPDGLRPYYEKELTSYQDAFKQSNLPLAWRHLERAHILGQPWAVEHSEVHWKMLKFGFAIKSWKEIRGQILRLVFGGVKSFVGKIPTGNTGGADVPPLQVMEIPTDLREMLQPFVLNT
ncbi:DUF3703 domain-containing protein [Phaeodactylibacter sp.]|uniref:DUF3703 domain-containing protein n=1 Tax=Phaeodactylibacter sp. TaxID=1940289 RepID=UPI0025F8852F|nr:DUF3703 domain-containing protein [Phaeodactylibacter sp.]MCI5092673.1 DUF3703 domain-containing protein [Phaeodactylibacter sp.]